MPLGELTDPEAVRAALDEFDELGRWAFLDKYRSGPARGYFLVRDGKRYDSKAIASAAYSHQFPGRSLRPITFNGGARTVARKLRSLGFEVIGPGDPVPSGGPPELDAGRDYDWTELGELFDFDPDYLGRVGGMVSRPRHDSLLLITHPGGARSIDYGDYWDGDDLIYTGRGMHGDQERTGQNRDLGDNRKAVFVFEPSGPRVLRFLGRANTVDEWVARHPDAAGQDRSVLRFRLRFDQKPRRPSGETDRTDGQQEAGRRPRPFDPNRAPRSPVPGEPTATPEETSALREKAVRGHHRLLSDLWEWLEGRGWTEIEEIPLAVDLWARMPRRATRVIFEAKTVRVGTEAARIRSAVAQLLEYRFFYGERRDRLCVVCDRPISDRRARLLDGLKIAVLWRDGSGFASGSAKSGELAGVR